MRKNTYSIEALAVHKSYDTQEVLHGVDVGIAESQLTLISGPSGSGKTTLLNIIGGIEQPDAGSVMHRGVDVTQLTPDERTAWRGQHMGYAFQRARFVSGLNVMQNIVAPVTLRGEHLTASQARWADKLCSTLGIDDLLSRGVAGLSGGQQQRVALARALVHQPDILLADEPTAAVDGPTKVEIHDLMRELVQEEGVTIALVSHDELSRRYADTAITVKDGQIT